MMVHYTTLAREAPIRGKRESRRRKACRDNRRYGRVEGTETGIEIRLRTYEQGCVSSLEIVFIRHAQGEHTLRAPASLDTVHPPLTSLGRSQAESLRERLQPGPKDLVVASPTLRTLQTAAIVAEGREADVFVSPWIGPRMFPLRPELHTLLCDYIMSAKSVKKQFPGFHVVHDHYWGLTNEGINRMEQPLFESVADQFLSWAAKRKPSRLLAISHDGTITHYRERLTGETYSRDHFLGDAAFTAVKRG